MTVDEFIDRLAKPQYVLRMAKPHAEILASYSGYPTQPMIKSARTRAANARKEIDDLIMQYVGSK